MTHTLIDIETLKVLVENASGHVSDLQFDNKCEDLTRLYKAITIAEGFIKHPVKPTVAANITGGVLQGASSNYPVDVYCLDFRGDEVEIDGGLCDLMQCGALVDPDFVEEVLEAVPDE